MAKEHTPDQIAFRTFFTTMIGAVLFIGVVIIFVL